MGAFPQLHLHPRENVRLAAGKRLLVGGFRLTYLNYFVLAADVEGVWPGEAEDEVAGDCFSQDLDLIGGRLVPGKQVIGHASVTLVQIFEFVLRLSINFDVLRKSLHEDRIDLVNAEELTILAEVVKQSLPNDSGQVLVRRLRVSSHLQDLGDEAIHLHLWISTGLLFFLVCLWQVRNLWNILNAFRFLNDLIWLLF